MIRLFTAMAALVLLTTPAAAQTNAGIDALRACVANSTNEEDSVVTARWLFIAMSRHPSLPQSVRVGDREGLDANRQMGALVNRILFDTCADETRIAIAASGSETAFQTAFGTLGEEAMGDLMTNPDVMASIVQLGAYLDTNRLATLMTAPK